MCPLQHCFLGTCCWHVSLYYWVMKILLITILLTYSLGHRRSTAAVCWMNEHCYLSILMTFQGTRVCLWVPLTWARKELSMPFRFHFNQRFHKVRSINEPSHPPGGHLSHGLSGRWHASRWTWAHLQLLCSWSSLFQDLAHSVLIYSSVVAPPAHSFESRL